MHQIFILIVLGFLVALLAGFLFSLFLQDGIRFLDVVGVGMYALPFLIAVLYMYMYKRSNRPKNFIVENTGQAKKSLFLRIYPLAMFSITFLTLFIPLFFATDEGAGLGRMMVTGYFLFFFPFALIANYADNRRFLFLINTLLTFPLFFILYALVTDFLSFNLMIIMTQLTLPFFLLVSVVLYYFFMKKKE